MHEAARAPDDDPIAGRRILFVVNVDWFFLSHRLPIARAAKEAGADVWVACTDTGQADDIRRNGLHFVDLPVGRKRVRVREEIATIVSLARISRRVAPHLVHHVTIKPVLYGSVVARLRRTLTVNAISGFGHVFGTEQHSLLRALVERTYRIALHNPRSITIFQNEEDRAEFTSRGFVPESRAVLIRGSGVDCDVFRPAPSQPQERIVMFASRMLREKGVEDFVRAARDLRADHPDVRFVLVGDPDDSPTSVSDAELRAWRDEGAVEWWGRSDAMEKVLPQASLVVLPTVYREGLPKVLLEAGACAVPMVATDVPGCRDVVRPGVTGVLVPPRDPVALAGAIRTLMADPGERQRMGAQARTLVVEEFSIERVVEQTLQLYRSLLRNQ